MGKQFLGKRKKGKIEKILGKAILSALTGGNDRCGGHYWAEVWTDETSMCYVNYKTGEIKKDGSEFVPFNLRLHLTR